MAREIERVKAELRDKRAKKFEDHVRSLVPRFTILAPQANRLADLIDEALREFHNEVEVNRLPESIDPLCKLPPILRKIAFEMAGTATEDAKVENIAKLVAAMSETITELNNRLERANNLAPSDRTLEQSRLKRFANSNGMSGWLVSSSLMFFSVMAGQSGDATTQQTLNLTVEQICITDFPEDEQPKEIPESLIEEPLELPNPTIDI